MSLLLKISIVVGLIALVFTCCIAKLLTNSTESRRPIGVKLPKCDSTFTAHVGSQFTYTNKVHDSTEKRPVYR